MIDTSDIHLLVGQYTATDGLAGGRRRGGGTSGRCVSTGRGRPPPKLALVPPLRSSSSARRRQPTSASLSRATAGGGVVGDERSESAEGGSPCLALSSGRLGAQFGAFAQMAAPARNQLWYQAIDKRSLLDAETGPERRRSNRPSIASIGRVSSGFADRWAHAHFIPACSPRVGPMLGRDAFYSRGR